jgi:hypothetical protein
MDRGDSRLSKDRQEKGEKEKLSVSLSPVLLSIFIFDSSRSEIVVQRARMVMIARR